MPLDSVDLHDEKFLGFLGDLEHTQSNSISWLAMRLAVTRLCMAHIEEFLHVAGVEAQGQLNLDAGRFDAFTINSK